MNYIKELNAFYQQIVFEPLSGAAVALWNTLMHFNNRCGWKKQFSVAASMLKSTAGVKGGTFQRARAELQEKGFITVTKRSGNQAALYEMISQIQVFDESGCFVDGREDEGEYSVGASEAGAAEAQGRGLSQCESVLLEGGMLCSDGADLGGAQTGAVKRGDLAGGKQMESSVKRQQDGAEVAYQPTDKRHFYTFSNEMHGKNSVAAFETNHAVPPIMNEKGMDGKAVGQLEHGADRSPDNRLGHNEENIPDDKVGRNVDDRSVHSADTLFKQKRKRDETIQDKTDQTITTTAAVHFYEANLGRISPYVQESMLFWIQDLGEELVIHAMKRTLEQNKTTWSYVQGILKAWAGKGIVNVQQAEADSAAFRASYRGAGKNQVYPKSGEVIPDWFAERKQKQGQEGGKGNVVPELGPVVPAEDDEELQELLKEFGVRDAVTV